MPHKIFFSWQSDTPTEWGRNFVERALTRAAVNLVTDLTVEESIRDSGLAIDKDTKGVSGTPPIVETIFKKIDGALAYVADLTFVGERRDGRPTPNPNVLVEYGWALKSLGHARIITVMNTAYGVPSDDSLPFNMKHLLWPIPYHLPEGSDDKVKQEVRKNLVGAFEKAIRAIFESAEFRATLPKAPEIPKFVEMESVDGPARFRKRNEPIGVAEGPLGIGGSREITLVDGPAMWLRVMPDQKQTREWAISELRANFNAGGVLLLPLGNFSSWSYVRAEGGFGYMPTMSNESDPVPAVILAFKTGELWSVYSGPSSTRNDIPDVEPMFIDCFRRCIHFLRTGLNVAPPYRWIAGMEGIKGKKLWKVAPPGRHYTNPLTGPCLTDIVTERGVLRDGEKWQLALKPLFHQLYDACGAERLDHADAVLLARFLD
jgi:hypothetical protein